MVSYEDDDESDAEDDTPRHIDTAVIQIKEVYPELGNLFVTGILNIIRGRMIINPNPALESAIILFEV